MREAINVGLTKLGFKEIREHQRKVVEAYVGGRDVLMVAPTGSGKSLTFHIAPFVLDFYKHAVTYLRHTQFFRANGMQIKFNIPQAEQVDSRLRRSLFATSSLDSGLRPSLSLSRLAFRSRLVASLCTSLPA